MPHLFKLTVTFILAFALAGCEGLPRDQEGTVERVFATGKIRVGLIENPPWTIRTEGEPGGAEVELIRAFAREMNAVPEWQWGSEEKLFGALENFELDLVAGGLSNSTPWSKRVGLTSAYYDEKYSVGVPRGVEAPRELKGVKVAVPIDAFTAGLVREQGGEPVPAGNIEEVNGLPVAAPAWKLEKFGLAIRDGELHSSRHVIATSPGENQMVKRLDEFLAAHRVRIPELLRGQPEE